MTVELWTGQEFETAHEREALRTFLAAMKTRFDGSDSLYLVLANYYIDGRQIDLTVLKNDAVIIVELKNCPDPFQAVENGPWRSLVNGQVIGNPHKNPLEQAKEYRFKWVNWLKAKQDRFLPAGKAESMDLYHVSAFVVITPALHPETSNALPPSPWFRLVGLDHLAEAVCQQTSPRLYLSDQELRRLAEALHLKSAQPLPVETPYSHFKESRYPADSYQQELQAIHGVIQTYNSLLVLGISGSGKSNLLRFLVSNPAAQVGDTVFVYMDGNSLDWHQDQAALQEEVLGQVVRDLAQQLPLPPPGEPVKQVLRSWMAGLSQKGPMHLVMVFDRSELLQDRLDESFFNYLRALRDVNPRLSFIFGGRFLVAEAFGELADVLWHEPYWVGSLSHDDARRVINRHVARLALDLDPAAAEKLLACAGRHPALLRYACELVKAGKVHPAGREAQALEELLAAPVIERQCRDIWQDLDLSAQDVLRHAAQGEAPLASPTVEGLVRSGLLAPGPGSRVDFTSPLFKQYVARLGPPPLTLSEGLVFKGLAAVNLSKEEFELLQVLWDHQPDLVSHDRISDVVWPEERGGVSPQMITSLVMRLRDKLGDSRYIDSVRGRGYRFIQGTAPLPRSAEVRLPGPEPSK